MNDIFNIKTVKSHKVRIVFVMSVIFFITPIIVKIHNTNILLKANKNNEKKAVTNNNKQKLKKEIEKHTDKINYILKISNTLGEAIGYIQQNYKDSTKSNVKTVLRDSIAGVDSIGSVLLVMHSDLENKKLNIETNDLEYSLNQLMITLDEKNLKMAKKIIDSLLSNEYIHWKMDIKNEFS